ncbi:MAG: ribosome modulation factor, partial [Gammaproteobacteria bacterium]|nr:ribosome modulation factor [Gammaproteobacteria bacterium]
SRGHQAGLGGRSKDSCPYENDMQKQSWLNGWHEGRQDQWSGYSGVSGVHKIASL